MTGTITALKFQQSNRERVSVYLDGEYAFGLTAVEGARLHKGQVLSDDEIAALRSLDERHRSFERAVRFLSYRPRSRAEVERYLLGKGIDGEVVVDVLQRLEQVCYLDDEAFARFWVENRVRFRPRSRYALRYELRQKGVSNHIINLVLADIDEEVAAWRAVEGLLYRWTGLPRDALHRKVAGYLSRRGFSYEITDLIFQKVCQALNIED